ncbi:MAG: DUF6898 family protein [Magnetovibrionaceae bacterium]
MPGTVKPEDVVLGDVLFEMIVNGGYVKVSAIDTRTNTEVSIVGDARASEQTLRDNAKRKLRYVIAKALSGS